MAANNREEQSGNFMRWFSAFHVRSLDFTNGKKCTRFYLYTRGSLNSYYLIYLLSLTSH